jgi:hypothetical protein
MACRKRHPGGVEPELLVLQHMRCCDDGALHLPCWVARAVLYSILEEEQRAITKVKKHPHTVAQRIFASCIVLILAVAEQSAGARAYEPADCVWQIGSK